MKRILLVAAVLALLPACSKKSEPKGDCAKAIDHAMSLSKEEYRQSNVADATLPEIRKVSLERCTEDKWSNAVLVCLETAKATADVIECQKKMTPEQQESHGKAVTAVMAAADDAAGGDAPEPAALPADCAAYKAVIEKLATCDKLPAETRTMLEQSFEASAKTWEGFDKLPADQQTALVDACKQGVETVTKMAGETCGW